MPGLYGKRLTIIYRAASDEDQRLIDEGKIHLAELKADMKADGELIASSFGRSSLRIGETEELRLHFIPPNPGIRVKDLIYRDELGERQYLGYPHPLYAGAVHNLSFDMAGDASRLIHNRLEGFFQKEFNDENVLSDEVMGELLYLAGLKYFQDTETEINELASLNGYINHRRIWSALTVQKVRPVIIAGLPTYLELTTNLINAVVSDSYSDLSFAIDGNTNRDGEIKRLGMMNASFCEHKVWEDVVGIEAISTIKALQYTKFIGIPIHTIDANNIQEIEQLNLSNERKQELRKLLDLNKYPGYRLIIPHSEFTYEDWTGIGYIWEHIEGGWGGYFISGEVNGGETVKKVWKGVKSTLKNTGETLRHEDVMKILRKNKDDIEKIAKKYNLPPALIAAIIYKEQCHLFPFEKELEMIKVRLGGNATLGLGQIKISTAFYIESPKIDVIGLLPKSGTREELITKLLHDYWNIEYIKVDPLFRLIFMIFKLQLML